MNFDETNDLRRTHNSKWDTMEKNYGVSPDDGIAMWIADMDFRSPDCVQRAVKDMLDNGNYGYYGNYEEYKNSIRWWMENRHNWKIEPEWIFTTHGICNAVGLLLQTFTQPDDAIILFTPVYHAFARVIKSAGRHVTECELVNTDGRYHLDIEAYEQQLTGKERMLILCSPHNPSGRVWTKQELQEVADFCTRNDLLLVSDEIHHDLVYPGANHIPMPLAVPEITDRLIMLTAPSKTFNTAGPHTGNAIIPDPGLRKKFATTMSAFSISPNVFGVGMTIGAYSPEGAAWVDDLVKYLDENRKLFDAGISAIPGLKSMKMDATYLSWVDFSGTGMDMDEVTARVAKTAKIAASFGPTFGKGGENYLRFNIGTQRKVILEAIDRLQKAFSDLQ